MSSFSEGVMKDGVIIIFVTTALCVPVQFLLLHNHVLILDTTI